MERSCVVIDGGTVFFYIPFFLLLFLFFVLCGTCQTETTKFDAACERFEQQRQWPLSTV
jgi:hypothetical protein